MSEQNESVYTDGSNVNKDTIKNECIVKVE